ncbi:MAG: NAD(+)/NADH kinase [Phascolarctobacterium sp.]|nr:NAD(+)/NADH kinase [Phascolarctobacterium sp.]
MKKLGIFPHMGKEKVCANLKGFIDLCRENHIEPYMPIELCGEYGCASYNPDNRRSMKKLDVTVSLGGDGTFLKMARCIIPLGIPGFGINFGKLGFLAEIDLPGIKNAVVKLWEGKYTIESRSLLRAEFFKKERCIITVDVLNDVVLAKGSFSKLPHIRLYINGKPSGFYAADGIIVATATGSTGYSLSAGGPLVQPELDISIITPICAHSLTARALVIPMSETIEIDPGDEDMVLTADGENAAEVKQGTYVRISKSPYKMQFIRLTGSDYYQTWQQKLMRNL